MLNFDCAAHTQLRVELIAISLVDVHVEDSVARAEQVPDEVVLRRISSSLPDQVRIEVNRSNVSSHNKSTDQRQLEVETFSLPRFVGQVSEHLFAALAAIVFALLAENANLHVVDLHERDDSTGSIEGEGAHLRAPVVRDACLEHNAAHKVLAHHENRLSDLVIARLRIGGTLEDRRTDPTKAGEKKKR